VGTWGAKPEGGGGKGRGGVRLRRGLESERGRTPKERASGGQSKARRRKRRRRRRGGVREGEREGEGEKGRETEKL
jgi:hypothetical protein